MKQDYSEGFRIASERIATEAVVRTGFLNLNNLRLAVLPAELSCLQHLQSLDCSYTVVDDLSPLAELRSLKRLSFSRTHVIDLSPLTELTALESLGLSCRGEQSNAAGQTQRAATAELLLY